MKCLLQWVGGAQVHTFLKAPKEMLPWLDCGPQLKQHLVENVSRPIFHSSFEGRKFISKKLFSLAQALLFSSFVALDVKTEDDNAKQGQLSLPNLKPWPEIARKAVSDSKQAPAGGTIYIVFL